MEDWIIERLGPKRIAFLREHRKFIGGMFAGGIVLCVLGVVTIPIAGALIFGWFVFHTVLDKETAQKEYQRQKENEEAHRRYLAQERRHLAQESGERGRLWWASDNEEEFAKIRARLEWQGVVFVKIDRELDPPRINYEFELVKAKAPSILQYTPDEDEWLK
jgi:hypothetical protein